MIDKNTIPILCHIPKTGGTTIDFFLTDQNKPMFKLDNAYMILDFKNYVVENGLEDGANIIGHSALGIHEYIHKQGKKHLYYTLLREPVSRMLSHYFYNIKMKFTDPSTDFVDFATCHNNVYLHFFNASSPQHAFDILTKDFSFFGLMENMDEFISLMHNNIGTEIIPVMNRNRNSWSFEIDEKKIDACKEIIAEDIKFYEMALDYYNKHFKGNLEVVPCTNDDPYSDLQQGMEKLNPNKSLTVTGDAKELEISGRLDEAEKMFIEVSKITKDPYHLIEFYSRTRNDKLIDIILSEIDKFEDLFESKPYYCVNRFFIPKINEIMDTLIQNPDSYQFGKFIEEIIPKAPRIKNLLRHINSCADDIRPEAAASLSTVKEAYVFGCGKAARIATFYAIKHDIEVIAYIDDFVTGTFCHKPVLSRKEINTDINTIIAGPQQHGNYDDLVSDGFKIIKMEHDNENTDN